MTVGGAAPPAVGDRARARPVGDPADGSVLMEAVVGIGLIAMLLGATFSAHRAATASVTRAEARTAAVLLAERELERPTSDIPPMVIDADGGTVSIRTEVLQEPLPCRVTAVGRGARREVVVGGDEDAGIPPTVLHGRAPSPGEGAEQTAALRVHLPPRPWSGTPQVEVHGPDGVRAGIHGSSDCWQFEDLTPGDHHIVVRVGTVPLIDRTHVLLDERPVRIGILRGATDVTVDADEPSLLTVFATTDGGRTPDVVHPGTVGWSIEGDDARIVTTLGGTRPVHPGRVGVVVSACANPGARASRRIVDVDGPAASVDVPLAIITVDGVAGRSDTTLELVRREGCADGTGQHPSLRWVGGLHEGMRIALPGGAWEARLLSETGARLTAPVTVEASGTPSRITLP